MLRAGGFVVVAVRRRMRQVPFGQEMNGALDDLSSTRHHGQGQEQSTNSGAGNLHFPNICQGGS